MIRKMRPLAFLFAAFALAAVVACSGGDDVEDPDDGSDNDDAGAVQVELTDAFAIELSSDTAPAGEVTFDVRNTGALLHEFVVVNTDLAADALPVEGAAVDETQLDILGAVEDLDPAASESVTVDLEAGTYLLICNIPGHFSAGMHTAFTVE